MLKFACKAGDTSTVAVGLAACCIRKKDQPLLLKAKCLQLGITAVNRSPQSADSQDNFRGKTHNSSYSVVEKTLIIDIKLPVCGVTNLLSL